MLANDKVIVVGYGSCGMGSSFCLECPGGAASISLELENTCDLHGSCLALAGSEQSNFCRKPGQGNSTYKQDRIRKDLK